MDGEFASSRWVTKFLHFISCFESPWRCGWWDITSAPLAFGFDLFSRCRKSKAHSLLPSRIASWRAYFNHARVWSFSLIFVSSMLLQQYTPTLLHSSFSTKFQDTLFDIASFLVVSITPNGISTMILSFCPSFSLAGLYQWYVSFSDVLQLYSFSPEISVWSYLFLPDLTRAILECLLLYHGAGIKGHNLSKRTFI